MASCRCGRQFRSDHALAQHQADMVRLGKTCKETQPNHWKRPSTFKTAWMWKGAKSRKAIGTIDVSTLNIPPGTAVVSSASGCDLICSYNWQTGKGPSIRIPGCLPTWQNVDLPITLSPSKRDRFPSIDSAIIPRHSFETLFQAVEAMNPSLRFNNVDIVVNRNTLRKLLDLCSGRTPQSFRVNLLQLRDTLFIERCEPTAAALIQGSYDPGWGPAFEKACTNTPAGWDTSAAHHRALRYQLGDLNCVVRFEVDASYEVKKDQGVIDPEMASTENVDHAPLESQLRNLSIQESNSGPNDTEQCLGSVRRAGLLHQSTAAEIKTSNKSKPLDRYMPQIWFGRSPWLIQGRHSNGTFHKVDVVNTGERFAKWERDNQEGLQKLVLMLKQLREIVRNHSVGNCIAIFEKASIPFAIKVLTSKDEKEALPKHFITKFWGA